MSAFVCSARQVGVLAQAIVKAGLTDQKPADLAAAMMNLNIGSVDYRYNEITNNFERREWVTAARVMAEMPQANYSDSELLGLIGCFTYQSCESDELMAGETYQLAEKFEKFLQAKKIESVGWCIANNFTTDEENEIFEALRRTPALLNINN